MTEAFDDHRTKPQLRTSVALCVAELSQVAETKVGIHCSGYCRDELRIHSRTR